MSNYIKKYNTGNIMVDSPYNNYIHELPLLSFGDYRNSVNISLVFNHKLKQDNNNMFNINNGYKLNIQKRIVMDSDNNPNKFIDSNGKQVLLIKNYNTLDQSTPFNGVYTFDDESKRVLRSISTGYEIEHEDLSREEYNLNGYITKIKDKYQDTYLSYFYNSNNYLSRVSYNNKTVYFGYFANQLNYIEYGNTETTLEYSTNKVTINHYTGVTFESILSDNNYEIKAIGDVTYSKRCLLSTYEISLESKVENNIIDSKSFVFPTPITDQYQAFDEVTVINREGVKQRFQFKDGKPLYSYEVKSDALFDLYDRCIENVQIYNTLDESINNSYKGLFKYNDGIEMRKDTVNNKYELFGINYQNVKGEYLLTGWIKSTQSSYATITVSNVIGLSVYEFNVSTPSLNKWYFFAYQFKLDANMIYVKAETDGTQLNDIKITYQATDIIDENKKSLCLYKESILLNDNGNILPLKDAEISYVTEGGSSGVVNATISDLLRYIRRKIMFEQNDEFYYDDGKKVINSILRINIREKNSSIYYNISDFNLGYRYYSDCKEYETIIEKYVSSTTAFLITNMKEESSYSTQYLNKYFDVVEETKEEITKYYTRDKGLIIVERIDNISNIHYTYDDNRIVVEDSYNNNYLSSGVTYYIDSIWGKVYKIENNDGTKVENTFDNDKSTLIKKTFSKNNNQNIIDFEYENGHLKTLTNGNLNYRFLYDANKLSEVKKFETTIEKQNHTIFTDTIYYPNEVNSIYNKQYIYDDYGRLEKVTNELQNYYHISPSFNDNGELTNTYNSNNKDAVLAMVEDKLTNQKIRYTYDLKGNITNIKTTSSTDYTDEINNQSIAYDVASRVTEKVYTYDIANGKKVKDEIEYCKTVDNPLIDEQVKVNNYYIDNIRMSSTVNEYNQYKNLELKKITTNRSVMKKEYTYQENNVNGKLNRISKEEFKINEVIKRTSEMDYDLYDRITTVDTNDKSITYEYDDFGRLIRENNEVLDKTIIYEYNEFGNIISKKEYSYTTVANITIAPIKTINYGYDSVQKDRLITFDNTPIAYNTLGCPSTFKGFNLTWEKGKLKGLDKGTLQTGIESYTYSYNAFGQRVSKTYSKTEGSNGLNSYYPGEVIAYNKKYNYDYFGRLINEIGTVTYYNDGTYNESKEYIYDANSIIGMRYKHGADVYVYYYDRNILGDVVGIYDVNGNLKVKYDYDAYGNCTISSETTNLTYAKANPIRYRGYYYDEETELFYCNSRYYNPEWGRWISPDDIEYLDPESVNGLNLYCYCLNDPIIYVDPDGHMALFWIALIAGGIAAGANVFSQMVFEDRAFNEIIWSDVIISGVAGFAGGLVPGSGFLSLVGQSAMSALVENGLRSMWYGEDFSIGKVLQETFTSVIVGTASMAISYGLNKLTSKMTDKLFIKVSNYSQHQHYFRGKGFNYTREEVYEQMYKNVRRKILANRINTIVNKTSEYFLDFAGELF